MTANGDPQFYITRLEYCVREQMKAIDRERAEVDRLRTENANLKAVIEGSANTLNYLRSIIWDEKQPVAVRLKAATAVLPYEHPKVATTNLVVVDFRERVRAARLKAAPVIEHQPIEPPPASPTLPTDDPPAA